MTSVFTARGVPVSFGGVRALAGVDTDVEVGQLVGLFGPDGAGGLSGPVTDRVVG